MSRGAVDTSLICVLIIAITICSFDRIARQMNYQREFLTPYKIKVSMPGGLPYEAFDQRACKVRVWSLLQLFESARSFSFWPVPHADRPNDSFADTHILLQDHFFFIVSTKLRIQNEFYNEATPKFPLSITNELDFIGRTSFKTTSVLKQPGVNAYAVSEVQTVLVDTSTRRPKPFPDWWSEKYGQKPLAGKKLSMPDLHEVPSNAYHCPIMVYPHDCDSYNHTNWTFYARYCADACRFGVMQNVYQNISEETLLNGIRELQISFKQESSAGDQLNIISWENNENLNFVAKKNDDTCAEVTMKFY